MAILKRSSYYKPDYSQSAALIRARRPYLFKNMATGAGIFAFTIGVYWFTINAVGQERFEDVVVPPPTDVRSQVAKSPSMGGNGR